MEATKRLLTVKETSKILNMPDQQLREGLKQGKFPWGTAIKRSGSYSYVIYKKKLEEYVGEVD